MQVDDCLNSSARVLSSQSLALVQSFVVNPTLGQAAFPGSSDLFQIEHAFIWRKYEEFLCFCQVEGLAGGSTAPEQSTVPRFVVTRSKHTCQLSVLQIRSNLTWCVR